MKIQSIKIDKLISDPDNARAHDTRNIDAIGRSLRRFGQQKPIVVNAANIVVAGNGTVDAALALGWSSIDAVRTELDGDEAALYAIADNRSSELASWNLPQLDLALADLDLEVLGDIGFDQADLDDLFPPDPVDADDIDDDIPDLGDGPPDSVVGEVYELGQHRLICGDATDPEVYASLLGDDRVSITFTSPPYNVGGNTMGGHLASSDEHSKYTHTDDQLSDDDYGGLLEAFTRASMNHSDHVIVNIQMLGANKVNVIDWLHTMRRNYVDVAIWNKTYGPPAMAAKVMNAAFEFLFFFSPEDLPPRSIRTASFRGTIQNVFQAPGQRQNEYSKIHAATFPIHLPVWVIESFTTRRGSVLDPFMGTGTTLIAAAHAGRTAYGIELDPRYCDIIRRRWTNHARDKGIDAGSGALD